MGAWLEGKSRRATQMCSVQNSSLMTGVDRMTRSIRNRPNRRGCERTQPRLNFSAARYELAGSPARPLASVATLCSSFNFHVHVVDHPASKR
jgi:hypothetical protein